MDEDQGEKKRAADAEVEEEAGAKKKAGGALDLLSRAAEDDEGDAEGEALHAAILERLQQAQQEHNALAHVSDSDDEEDEQVESSSGGGGGAGAKVKAPSKWMQPKKSAGPRVGSEFQAELPEPQPSS